jgi:hypothetical protein
MPSSHPLEAGAAGGSAPQHEKEQQRDREPQLAGVTQGRGRALIR